MVNSSKLIKLTLSSIPIWLIYFVSSSVVGLDYSELKVFLLTIVMLCVGIFYGIMLTIKIPSDEFVKDCMEYEKEGE